VNGSEQQLAALREDDEFTRNLVDASLVVKDLQVSEGYANEGIARQMQIYQEAVAKVPQTVWASTGLGVSRRGGETPRPSGSHSSVRR
jgi:hypothetical protein